MTEDRLAIVAAKFFNLRRNHDRHALLAKLRELLVEIVNAVTKDERTLVDALLAGPKAMRAPPELVNWVRDRAGRLLLVKWVLARGAPIGRQRATAIVDRMVADAADPQRLLEAAIRLGAARPAAGDAALVEQSFKEASQKESVMANQKVNFSADPRGLPAGFVEADFVNAVNGLLANTFGLPPVGNENTYGAIIGILLLNEQADQKAVTFLDAVREAWNETLVPVTKDPSGNPKQVPSRAAYEVIATKLADKGLNLVPRDANDVPNITYQQFAFVARFVISKSDDVWLDHPNLPSQIRIGLDQYVAGPPLFETLDLPPLGDDAQIVDDNVRAVGTLAACYFLERARLIDVLDSVTDEFVLGKVPIGNDAAGRALDDYRTIPREKLLSPVERSAVYSRVLGFAGGDVPKTVLPNKEWGAHVDKFIAAVAEYDRQRRVALFFNNAAGNQRPLSYTGELVRKAGNDLGRISSLYGYAGSQFDARRVAEMVQRALRILTITSLQRAYGVTNPYQLIERVASANLGQSVNVVKYKTMAESVKAIMDIIAKYAPVWSRTGGTPLFNDDLPAAGGIGLVVGPPGDINNQDRDDLINRVQYWLAVTGTGDQQVEKMSQPSPSLATPSIPQLYGGNGHAQMDASAIDKIRQMVSGGSAPSLDQLKQLLPAMGA